MTAATYGECLFHCNLFPFACTWSKYYLYCFKFKTNYNEHINAPFTFIAIQCGFLVSIMQVKHSWNFYLNA
jgi:hypothetical protein